MDPFALKFAKAISVDDLAGYARLLESSLKAFTEWVNQNRAFAGQDFGYWPKHYWSSVIRAGGQVAEPILAMKEIPSGKEKTLELALRLVQTSSRVPSNIFKWYDTNLPRLKLLLEAATSWPDKVEGVETDQTFKMGPFTVHNSTGLTGDKLGVIKTAIEKVVKGIQRLHAVPGIEKVLYGNVHVVAKIQRTNWAAWYVPNTDDIFMRPLKNVGFDEIHALIHELGHRYWTKFASHEMKKAWWSYHYSLERPNSKITMPKVGDPLPVPLKGSKTIPTITAVVPGVKFELDVGGFVNYESLYKLLVSKRVQENFPTAYSTKSLDEHFCEALALRALDQLKSPHLEAFEQIVEGKAPMHIPAIPKMESAAMKTAVVNVYEKLPFFAHLLQSEEHLWFRAESVLKNGNFTGMLVSQDDGAKALRGPVKKSVERDWMQKWDLVKEAALPEGVKARFDRVKTAGSTYVQISREDLEAWLDTLSLHGKWHLLHGKAGVYMLPLSDSVAVKLGSTIGTQDDAMGRGEASMQLALVSSVVIDPRWGPMVLNKKAQGQSHFARTLNWKTNWKTGVTRMRDAYLKSKGFYDALALIDDREAYKADIMARIEAVPGWQQNHMLADFRARVEQGGILTVAQAEALVKMEHKTPSASAPSGTADDALLGRMRELYKAARAKNDSWLLSFLTSVGQHVKSGGKLSEKQLAVLTKNFASYGI